MCNIRTRLVRWLCCASILLLSLPAFAQESTVASQDEDTIIRLVNQERAKVGLPPLQVDQRLTKIARQHSQEQAARSAISHQFPDEKTVRERIASTGLRFNFSGENVAFDSDIQSAHVGLMNSQHHRENILKPEFDTIGVGVVRRGRLIYVTQDFAKRLPELSAEQAEHIVLQTFGQIRRASGAPPIPFVPRPSLRELACDMAQKDRLETDLARDLGNVHNVVVWTATEPAKLPASLQSLRNTPASGWSLGACFAASAHYPNPVWWMVGVTYF